MIGIVEVRGYEDDGQTDSTFIHVANDNATKFVNSSRRYMTDG